MNTDLYSENIIDYQILLKKSNISNLKVFENQPENEISGITKREHLIICKICNFAITSIDKETEINGSHTHSFTNPAGINFRIGCFAAAEGCVNYDEPTLENTWFPGYQWCYALCSECISHLGWFYLSGQHSFYGLILDKLIINN